MTAPIPGDNEERNLQISAVNADESNPGLWDVTVSGYEAEGGTLTLYWGDDSEPATVEPDTLGGQPWVVRHQYGQGTPLATRLDDLSQLAEDLTGLSELADTLAEFAGLSENAAGAYLVTVTQDEQTADLDIIIQGSVPPARLSGEQDPSDPYSFVFTLQYGPPETTGLLDAGDGLDPVELTTDKWGTGQVSYRYTPQIHPGGGDEEYVARLTIGSSVIAADPVTVPDRIPLAIHTSVQDANRGIVQFTVVGAYDTDQVLIAPDGAEGDTQLVCDITESATGRLTYTYPHSGLYAPVVRNGEQTATGEPVQIRLPLSAPPTWPATRVPDQVDTYTWTVTGGDPWAETYVLPYGADDPSVMLPVTYDVTTTGTTEPFTYTRSGAWLPVLTIAPWEWTAAFPILTGQGEDGGGGSDPTSGGVTPWGQRFGPVPEVTSWGHPRKAWINGMPLGVTDSENTDWMLVSLDGWRGSPASTIEVTQRPAAHGAWTDPQPFLQSRQLEAKVTVIATSPRTMRDAVESLILACPLEPFPLVVEESGLQRMCTVQRNGEVLVDSSEDTDVYSSMSLPMVAADPRRYSVDEHQVALTPPYLVGGLRLPTMVPFIIGAQYSRGRATITNTGTTSAPWRAIITGPTDGDVSFGITNELAGTQKMTFTQVLPATRWVEIDSAERTVLLDGTTSRRMALKGTWFEVPPGTSDVWLSTASGRDPGCTLSFYWRDAWM